MSAPRVGAVFPGQGSQRVGMGGRVTVFPEGADLFRRAERILGYDLFALLQNGPEEKLRETEYSQPAIFVTNYALAASVGGELSAVASAGHSFAEYCSLTLAGALTFEDALELVRQRGLAMQQAAKESAGAMSAVLGLDIGKIRAATEAARSQGRVQLANFNAPGQIVISGDRAAVERAGELAAAAGAKRVVPLNVSGAWHSALMEPARERFAPFVERVAIALPRFPVISSVDAETYRDVATIRRNLIRSVTDEVLWHATAERLIEQRLDLVLEFGGSAVLTPLIRRLPNAPRAKHVGDENGVYAIATELGMRAPA